MAPVSQPAIKKGMDVRSSLFEHRSALNQANTRLRSSARFYNAVKGEFDK